MSRAITPLIDRLMSKVSPEPNSGCWLWEGATDGEYGYGRMVVGSRKDGSRHTASTHRISWELHCGPIPSGKLVLHKCDMPACVNPDHLFLGTDADNMADKVKKNRAGQALTPEKVLEIRQLALTGLSHRIIGDLVGCTQTCASDAIARRTWSHIGA